MGFCQCVDRIDGAFTWLGFVCSGKDNRHCLAVELSTGVFPRTADFASAWNPNLLDEVGKSWVCCPK